tara:strand:- start:80754 stop:80981 length:228 start_codon:yes stop_codon:yes gene_type:complete
MESAHFMVVMIVAVSVGSGAYMSYLKTRRAEAEARGSGDSDELRREVADLRARVKTLERIVTDKERELSREIERL